MSSNFDFSRCLIDFTKCPKGVKLIKHFPQLSAFPEFKDADDNEIKIAIAISDLESPMIKINDRESMLIALFEFLEIPTDKPKQKEFFNEVFYYRHEKIAMCKARYLQMLHNTDWTEWVTANDTFTYLTFESVKPQKKEGESDEQYMKKRVKIKEDLRTTGRQLKELEAIIFIDSKSAREAALVEAKKGIISYPEKYAVKRQVV